MLTPEQSKNLIIESLLKEDVIQSNFTDIESITPDSFDICGFTPYIGHSASDGIVKFFVSEAFLGSAKDKQLSLLAFALKINEYHAQFSELQKEVIKDNQQTFLLTLAVQKNIFSELKTLGFDIDDLDLEGFKNLLDISNLSILETYELFKEKGVEAVTGLSDIDFSNKEDEMEIDEQPA